MRKHTGVNDEKVFLLLLVDMADACEQQAGGRVLVADDSDERPVRERRHADYVIPMDIFNRPPAIAEDTLQYALFPPPATADADAASAFAAAILAFQDDLLPAFIWHRDAFELKVIKNPHSDTHLLQGRMRVGDSVDDEWAVVWLLKQISAKWDLAISCVSYVRTRISQSH